MNLDQCGPMKESLYEICLLDLPPFHAIPVCRQSTECYRFLHFCRIGVRQFSHVLVSWGCSYSWYHGFLGSWSSCLEAVQHFSDAFFIFIIAVLNILNSSRIDWAQALLTDLCYGAALRLAEACFFQSWRSALDLGKHLQRGLEVHKFKSAERKCCECLWHVICMSWIWRLADQILLKPLALGNISKCPVTKATPFAHFSHFSFFFVFLIFLFMRVLCSSHRFTSVHIGSHRFTSVHCSCLFCHFQSQWTSGTWHQTRGACSVFFETTRTYRERTFPLQDPTYISIPERGWGQFLISWCQDFVVPPIDRPRAFVMPPA